LWRLVTRRKRESASFWTLIDSHHTYPSSNVKIWA
jgi:hypothetical protein